MSQLLDVRPGSPLDQLSGIPRRWLIAGAALLALVLLCTLTRPSPPAPPSINSAPIDAALADETYFHRTIATGTDYVLVELSRPVSGNLSGIGDVMCMDIAHLLPRNTRLIFAQPGKTEPSGAVLCGTR